MKRSLRITVIIIASIAGLMLVFALIGIAPINRNVNYLPLLDTMTSRIQASDESGPSAGQGFTIGFSKISLTPAEPVATAGYGKRLGQYYKTVHDSIFVRTLVIDNGAQRVAIVSADLLIIPPTVTTLLTRELPGIHFSIENTYLGATHSHNSIGNWAKGIPAVLYGAYQDSIVHFIADKIKASIVSATRNMLPATIRFDSVAIPDAVYNRVTDGGPVDPLLRYLEIERSDNTKLLFASFTAHATCLFSRDMVLSADYPGKLMELLEAKGYTFSMFMAGAVGSHGPDAPEGGFSCVDWMADKIAGAIEGDSSGLRDMKNTAMEVHRIPLALPGSQPKVLHDWRLRPWLFEAAFGEYPAFISVLRIGDIVFLGTPCDFSGEFNFALDSLAARHHVFPIVTSFNGGYIGYLTPEKYYDIHHYETQLMNWYGPGNGEYVKHTLEKLLISVSDN